MICIDCFKTQKPQMDSLLAGLNEMQAHNEKELTRLFSLEKQEEFFKPYRDRIDSLLEAFVKGSISESQFPKSLKALGANELKSVEYTCESCGKEVSEDFEIPIRWLIEDEYRQYLVNTVTKSVRGKLGITPVKFFEQLDFTYDYVTTADEINDDSALDINSVSLSHLVQIRNLIPNEMGAPSDTRDRKISIYIKVYRLFLANLLLGNGMSNDQLLSDIAFQVNLLGKDLSDRSEEWVLTSLTEAAEDVISQLKS